MRLRRSRLTRAAVALLPALLVALATGGPTAAADSLGLNVGLETQTERVFHRALSIGADTKRLDLGESLSNGGFYRQRVIPKECRQEVPTTHQFKGRYNGFATWYLAPNAETNRGGFRNASLGGGVGAGMIPDFGASVLKSVFGDEADLPTPAVATPWVATVEVLRASNRYWDTYAAHITLRGAGARSGRGEYTIFVRGMRPLNARAGFLRGVVSAEDLPDPAAQALVEESDTDQLSLWRSIVRGARGGPGDEELYEAADAPPMYIPEGACHVVGSMERLNYHLEKPVYDNDYDDVDIDDGDDARGDEERPHGIEPPIEVGARHFDRAPDMVLQLAFSGGCGDALPGRFLAVALRKFSLAFYKRQHDIIGVILSLKTQAELLLCSIQLRSLLNQRAMLKTSHWMVVTFILYDSFEAQYFFEQQAVATPSIYSALAIAGILKVVLVCVIEMRWLITLWKQRAIQRSQAMGSQDPHAWVKDLNRAIRSSAAVMVIVLIGTTNLFEPFPELVLGLFSLMFVPQIVKNVYDGVRHPLRGWFVAGLLACRAVLPILLWSRWASNMWLTYPAWDQAKGPFTPAWPAWFRAPALPADFIDVLGRIPRRPNPTFLSLIICVYLIQGLYIYLQWFWSPRIGIPESFARRFLPVVFDYETDVARIAAQKQLIDPNARSIDCVICFTAVKFAEPACVVTPCEHFFHKDCLLKWMDVKMECPTCRRMLPPF